MFLQSKSSPKLHPKLFFLVCFLPTLLWGQNTFFKKYGRESYENYLSTDLRSILQQDQSLYLFGTVNNGSATQKYHDVFIKINQNGKVLYVRVDSSISFVGTNTAIFKEDFFYTAGYKITSEPTYTRMKIIRKVDLNGDVIWTKTFGDSSESLADNIPFQIHETNNNLVVFGTNFDGLTTTDTDFTLFNFEGSVINSKLYSVSQSIDYYDRPIGSVQIEDGFLLLLQGLNGPSETTYQPNVLLKLDNIGDEIWRLELNNFPLPEREEIDSMQTASGVFKMKNNHFGVAFDLFKLDETGQFLISNKKVLAEFDENGNYIRSKEFLKGLVFNAMKIQSNENGEFFIFGSYTDPVNLADLFVVKLDENFNVLWYKNYGYDGVEFFSDAILTSDGGVIILGSKTRYSYPAGRDFFLVKTDCEGNIEWDSQSCLIESDEELLVIENPIKETLVLQFPSLSDEDVLEFELVNSLGQIVREKISAGLILTENIANLSVGMYLYRVHVVGGKTYVGKVIKQ